MRRDKKILKNSLKQLVNRFGREDFVSAILQNPPKDELSNLPLSMLSDNHYLRAAKIVDYKIESEKKTLRENHTIDPIIVRKYRDKYEVVVGRIRYIAAKSLKLETLPVIILTLGEEESLLFMLKEISDRKTMNIYELALLCSYLKNDFLYKNRELADFLDRSSSQISNLLQILNMPSDILKDISQNRLTYGHAKAISRLSEDEVREVVDEIYEKHLSVRETETLVRKIKSGNNLINNTSEVSDLTNEINIEKEVSEPKTSFEINGNIVTLVFKDEVATKEGLKRINKLIKRKKFVLK